MAEEQTRLERAREMYFAHRTLGDIAKETGLQPRFLYQHVYGSGVVGEETWQRARDLATQQLAREYVENNFNCVREVMTIGIGLIKNTLAAEAARRDEEGQPIPLTLRDAKMTSEILANLHKLLRIAGIDQDSGGRDIVPATARAATIEDLVDALLRDQFIEMAIMKKAKEKRSGDESRGTVESKSLVLPTEAGGTGTVPASLDAGVQRSERTQDAREPGSGSGGEEPIQDPFA